MSMAVKSRQLNLDELRRLKWLLGGAMALVSLWTVFFLDIEALGLVGFVSVAILAVLVWPRLPGKVPPLVWKLSVPAIIAVGALDFYSGSETLPMLIRLSILLVFYRAVSYRRKREDLQLIVLGLFLIVVAGVLTVSPGFAVLLLLFTACALGFLFVITLSDASEAGVPATPQAAAAWTRLDGRRFFARLREAMDWRLAGFALVLFTAVVVMSGLLFLVIPRFELASGFFLDRYITRKSRIGFSDNLKFGDVTELVRDNSVAMRVDLTDLGGLVERPYWRMAVLDEYTGQGFKVSAGLKAELMRSQRVTQQINGRPADRGGAAAGGVWTFYVEPGVSRFLPLPGSFVNLRLRDPVPLQYGAALRMVAFRSETMAMAAFQLEGVVQTPRLADARFAESVREARAQPGRFDPRIRSNPLLALAAPEGPANGAVLQRVLGEITGGNELSAAEFARRATAWLRAHHAYALSARIPPGEGRDDIVRWLDSGEPGFCEYFAAAFAVLARAAGHPARVISGFHGGVLNAFENYYMVRNSDAHAWAEIYDGREAWLRIDPSPGGAVTDGSVAAQLAGDDHDRSWSARFDSLRVLWYRRIVNFDSRTQVQMLERVKTFTADAGTAMRSWLEKTSEQLQAWAGGPWNTMRRVKFAGLLAGAAALIWMLRRLVRAGWRRFARSGGRAADPVRVEAGRWLAWLRADEGRARRQVTPATVEDLRRLRYGPRESWPEPRRVFRRAKKERRGK